MAYYFPEGSKFFFSTTFAGAIAIASLSNAAMAVAGAVDHGLVDDDEILLASGWDDATDSVFRADQLTADTFGLKDLDSTDTNFYPAGTGVGTARKVSNWTEIPQILTINSQGGDPRFTAVKPLSRRNGFQVPVGSNPESVTIVMGHDASNANYKTMLAISRRLTKCAFKQVISGGAVIYGYGYMYVTERPAMNNDQPNSVTAAISVIGRTLSY